MSALGLMTGDGVRRVKVVGIGGSFRVGSASLAALDIALRAATTAGAAVEGFSVSDLRLPLFDHDPTAVPPSAALILAGHDPPFLTGEPVGLISAAGGTQALQAINTMDFAARALRAWVVPFVVPVQQAWGVFDSDGRPRDDVDTQGAT